MSQRQSPTTPLYVSTSSTDFMAEALLAPTPVHLPISFQHRWQTPQPLRLPPLSIYPEARPVPVGAELPRPVRLPSLQEIAPHPLGGQDSAAERAERTRSTHAAPLADILSPQPQTSRRPEAAVSPIYGARRSSLQRPVEPASTGLYAFGRHTDIDAPSGAARLEAFNTSPVDDLTHLQRVATPSPMHTPTFDAGMTYQTRRMPQYFPREAISSAAHLGTYDPSQQASVALTSSSAARQSTPRLQYELQIRQQPVAARACGFGERDRRVIDPPPIIQLVARDHRGATVKLDEFRCSQHIIFCTLMGEDGLTDRSGFEQPGRPVTRRLMGQLAASSSVAKDEHDIEGCFFCFPDLSCRTHGRYRLRFVVIRFDPAKLRPGDQSPVLTEVLSDIFSVYTAKDFPGMLPSSALTRALKLQGCNIQVKKGSDRALTRKRQSFDDNEGQEEADNSKRSRNTA